MHICVLLATATEFGISSHVAAASQPGAASAVLHPHLELDNVELRVGRLSVRFPDLAASTD